MGGDPGRSNTLYLTRRTPEFERLSPVLGGLLADLKDTIHAWDIAGRRLDKPLLILIDEAGQLELGWLPAEVSTIAALGAFFVTCWQNLSQIQHRYGTLADAVLSGHRTKCFFAGVDDLTTTRYLTTLLGPEYVTRLSTSNDVPSLLGGRDVGPPQRVPSRATRRLRPAEHGPPDDPRRSGAAARHPAADPPRSGPLVDPEGTRRTRSPRRRRQPVTADDLPTCPLGPDAPAAETPTSTKRRSTRPSPSWPTSARRSRGHEPGGPGPGQMTLPDATSNPAPPSPAPSPAAAAPSPRSRRLQLVPSLGQDPAVKDAMPSGASDPPPPARNPVRRRTPCMSCGVILRVGEGDTRASTRTAAPTSGLLASVPLALTGPPRRLLTRRPDEPIVRVRPSDRIPLGHPMHRTLRPRPLPRLLPRPSPPSPQSPPPPPAPATECAAASPHRPGDERPDTHPGHRPHRPGAGNHHRL